MRRGAGVRAMAALAGVLGALMLFGASASAKTAQTITFTSTPPTTAVAGESYEVSATSSSGLGVGLTIGGACSYTKPQPGSQKHLPEQVDISVPPEVPLPSPKTVYFVAAGKCTIVAGQEGNGEYERAKTVVQEVEVARDPAEQITFTSPVPTDAAVGGSYKPSVRSSVGLEVFFSSATPAVCAIRSSGRTQEGESVSFLGTGTCTVDASQEEGAQENSPVGAPEAQQSFTVKILPEVELSVPMAGGVGQSDAVEAKAIEGPRAPKLSSATPSICRLSSEEEKKGMAGTSTAIVRFIAEGTCTVVASLAEASEYLPVEEKKSFAVSGPSAPSDLQTPTKAKETPTKRHRTRCPVKRPKCATLIVEVYRVGGPHPGRRHDDSRQALFIAKLGPAGEELSSIVTDKHRVRVSPGEYEVWVDVGGSRHDLPGVPLGAAARRIAVGAGQTLKITLTIQEK